MTSPGFGSLVATIYEQIMVPMVFAPYAEDLIQRLSARPLGDVLETAAGTGVVTRNLAALGANGPKSLVATDASPAMLDLGRSLCRDPRVTWQLADAMALPFADASFDLVITQFGAMFFPDRPTAYREARRVLRPGGRFVFSTWDRLPSNEFAHAVSAAVAELFPANPPTFLERVPHGYFETDLITRELAQAGFEPSPTVQTVVHASLARNARTAAEAFVRGTPLYGEITQRDATKLDAAIRAAERALLARFGEGAIEGRMQALLVSAQTSRERDRSE